MKHFQFSKIIIIFETLLVAYISYKTLAFTELSIVNNYSGSLPYLTTMISAVWAAYGTSVSFYYNKSKAENTAKINNQNIDCEV